MPGPVNICQTHKICMVELGEGILCWISSTIYPKQVLAHVLSWADHFIHVGLRTVSFRAPDLVKYLGEALWKWDRGMELYDAPGLTLMCRGLLP